MVSVSPLDLGLPVSLARSGSVARSQPETGSTHRATPQSLSGSKRSNYFDSAEIMGLQSSVSMRLDLSDEV